MASPSPSVFPERTLRTLRSLRAPSLPTNSSSFFRLSRQWEASPIERRALRQTFKNRSASILDAHGYAFESLEFYAGVPFTAHPRFAHCNFAPLQAVFAGGTLQRLVVLKPLSEQSAPFSCIASALLALFNNLLQTNTSSVTDSAKTSARSSSFPVLRSVLLPLPSLDGSTFRIFRVPGASANGVLSGLPSVSNNLSKRSDIALAPHSAASSALSTLTSLGPLSFLRVNFPLALFVHKLRTES